MSYCRMGEDSDVYVFASGGGRLECCGCRLPGSGWWGTTSRKAMMQHLHEHKRAGHKVPNRAFMRLWRESEELGEA